MPTWTTFTEPGGHVDNEDAFAVMPHPMDPECILCFVADGMGGQAGGGLAARTACRVGVDLACALPRARLSSPSEWVTLLHRVDAAIEAEDGAGYTTLIGFSVRGKSLVGASSGDSAVQVISSGERPHIVTESQRKNPPVGSGGAVFVPFAALLSPPWRVSAMTDGVWKYVGWDRIFDILAREQASDSIARLQERARLPGSGRFQDDFTVVVIEQDFVG